MYFLLVVITLFLEAGVTGDNIARDSYQLHRDEYRSADRMNDNELPKPVPAPQSEGDWVPQGLPDCALASVEPPNLDEYRTEDTIGVGSTPSAETRFTPLDDARLVPIDDANPTLSNEGNPTRSIAVNNIIKKVKKAEVRKQGKDSEGHRRRTA